MPVHRFTAKYSGGRGAPEEGLSRDSGMTAGRTTTSQSVDWCTPPKYVDAVRDFFGGTIGLDPCSNEWSIVGADTEWSLPENDGLNKEWNYASIYVNPPYGADRARGTTIKNWLRKCADAHDMHNAEVLALIPVAANTNHWKQYVWGKATAACFLYDTRLKFLENGNAQGKGAPMACAMIYWGHDYEKLFSAFVEFGAVVDLRQLIGKAIGYSSRSRLL